MATDKYAGIVKAAMKGESALWDIGDEIVKVLGRRANARNDGSYAQLKDIVTELADSGIDRYQIRSLAEIHLTASSFQKPDRIEGISFAAHMRSGSPETLRAAIVYGEQQGVKKISQPFVQKFKKVLEAEEREARKEAHNDAIAAKKEAEAEAERAREEKRAANSKEAKEAAGKREHEARDRAKEAAALARDLQSPPSVNNSAAKKNPADIPILVVRTSFSADVQKAKALAEKMSKNIEPHLEDLSDAFVTSAVDELLEVADAFRKLSHKIRSAKANKRSHLYAVGE